MNAEPQNTPLGGHDVPLTPPPVSGAGAGAAASGGSGAAGPGSGSGDGSGSGNWRGKRGIAIATAIIGSVALVISGGSAALAATNKLSSSTDVQSVGIDGIDGIDLDAGVGDVTVQFGDVDQAVLETKGSGGSWTLSREDDDLVVRSPESSFGWWFGRWMDNREKTVLTLPESLRSADLDGDFTLNAGSIDIDGDFGELDLQVHAGSLSVVGSASSVEVEMNAGRADVELSGVNDASLTVSAGRMVAELYGSAPNEIFVDVSAGSLDLTVPDVAYDVRESVSAGELDNRLQTSSSAQNTIEVQLSAGSAKLRSDR